jgi:flagellar biosynthetic protein FliR
MMSISVSLTQLQMFLLVFIRTGAFLLSIPMLNASSVPLLFRIVLALAVSGLTFPVLKLAPLPLAGDVLSLGVAATGELLLGILAGFSIRLVLEGVQLAGQLAGYQMGLAIAEVIDPATEDQVALLGQFLSILATLVFLIVNGHHWFIRTLVESYTWVPPLGFQVNTAVTERLARLVAEVFVIGIRAGAPVIVALFLSTIAFGLVARTVPQMNVFIVSMPLNIGVGLLFFGLSLSHLATYIGDLFGGIARTAAVLLRSML